jgi:hypothetical protein
MYLNENFLKRVFGVIGVAQHQVSRLVHQILIFVKKSGESHFISSLATTYQDQIHILLSSTKLYTISQPRVR